jgi:hypothetical protein
MGDDGYGAWRLWEVLKPEWERLNRETVKPSVDTDNIMWYSTP